jgi:NAD(P)-dependent dehydrogenase (short-subunit alcohol dehydrogenase family)
MTSPGVALVVGAAGDIGRATCRLLSDRGLTVAGWDIQDRPDALPVSHWSTVDAGDGDIPDALAAPLDELGELRFVFHIAGGSDAEELAQPDPARAPIDVIRRTVGLNLFSAYGVIGATVERLRAAHGDRAYTLVSSINAYGGYGLPGYSAAKAGLHGLVRALTPVLGRDRIRINAVALGTTRTANYAALSAQLGEDADFDQLGERMPRGAVLDPVEAATALLSIGWENPAVSGAILVADAGQSILRPDLGQ